MSKFRYAFSLPKSELAFATPLGTMSAEESDLEGSFILNPEPSEDPADPLNWPLWRKAAVLSCMSLFGFVVNFTSSSIASALPILATPLAFNPPVPQDKLSQLIAVNVLMIGVANIIWVPLANALGRRPVVLLGILVLCLCSVWAGLATSFESLLAARAVMGVGSAPADTVAPKVVGEIFFIHQSGRAMGIYTGFLTIGPLVGGLCGGYIAGHLGLAWIHWINVILAASLFVLCFFLVPESLYDRQPTLPRTITESGKDDVENVEKALHVSPTSTAVAIPVYASFSYWKSLGMKRPTPLTISAFLAPFKTLRLPGVWLVMLWYGGLVGGVVTMSTIGPQFVAAPPYLWGANAGLVNVGGIIGALLGAVFTLTLADRTMRAKGASGTRYVEPEARLPVAFPGLFLATAGLWVFGFSAQYTSTSAWVGLEVGTGMVSFGIMQIPSIGFNYLIESYGPVVADCFTIVTMLRAVISFAWTFFVGSWAHQAGPAVPFGVFGGMMGFFSLLVIPFSLWGKRLRIATEGWV